MCRQSWLSKVRIPFLRANSSWGIWTKNILLSDKDRDIYNGKWQKLLALLQLRWNNLHTNLHITFTLNDKGNMRIITCNAELCSGCWTSTEHTSRGLNWFSLTEGSSTMTDKEHKWCPKYQHRLKDTRVQQRIVTSNAQSKSIWTRLITGGSLDSQWSFYQWVAFVLNINKHPIRSTASYYWQRIC